jgi:hypothetical protein
MTPIKYSDLNSKQKEIYNFQKVAAFLADYGFNCIKLSDDWQGADFLAYHMDGISTLRVQLKSRLSIAKKYEGKELQMAFPVKGIWYLISHDKLVKLVSKHCDWLKTASWIDKGAYTTIAPSKALMQALQSHRLEASAVKQLKS